MRIGIASDDAFMKSLGGLDASMRTTYAGIMARGTATSTTSVMLGDSTVKNETTFDPTKVHDALVNITSSLEGWKIQDANTTANDDKRRLFTKFSVTDSGFKLSGHLSLQYHVLLYYTTNQRVLDCQAELSEIIDKTKGHDEHLAKLGDEITKSKLKVAGIQNQGEQEIFEVLYNDNALRDEIASEIDAHTDADIAALANKKAELYAELDKYLLEVYQTSQVLIDEARLVNGEEGYVFALDIEANNGTFDPSSISDESQGAILKRMAQLKHALERT